MPTYYAESDELPRGAMCYVSEGPIKIGDGVKYADLLFDAHMGGLTNSFLVSGLIRHFANELQNLFVVYPKGKMQSLNREEDHD